MATQTRYVPALAVSVFVGATIAVAADAPSGGSREGGSTRAGRAPTADPAAAVSARTKASSDEPVRAP